MNRRRQFSNVHKRQNPGLVKAALHDLRNALIELYHQDTPKLLVYGSQARGEARQTSDIDVLLLYPNEVNPGLEIRRVSPILADLNLRYQVLISVLPIVEKTYQSEQSLFWENVRRESLSVDGI